MLSENGCFTPPEFLYMCLVVLPPSCQNVSSKLGARVLNICNDPLTNSAAGVNEAVPLLSFFSPPTIYIAYLICPLLSHQRVVLIWLRS